MWIKICANTNLDDAALAAELGADALGFVFAPSPRRVTPEQVAAITPHLPAAVEKIGVFDTLDPEEILAAVQTACLTGVQLHAGYTPQVVAAIATRNPSLRIIQTNHWRVGTPTSGAFQQQLKELRAAPHIHAVLI